MNDKPGVMIYFELREVLAHLNNDDAGELFRAILYYGETGDEPALEDHLLILWPLIRNRLDLDDQRYRNITDKRRYAAYVRWTKDENTMTFEQWRRSPDYRKDPEPIT